MPDFCQIYVRNLSDRCQFYHCLSQEFGISSLALVNYPILRMVDWANTIFSRGGHFFLGGHSLENPEPFQQELQRFWERFQVTDPNFPIPQKSEWSKCIPIAVHGDEGRGRLKSPIMIITVQPILPLIGCKTNMQGNLIFEYVVLFGFDFALENWQMIMREQVVVRFQFCMAKAIDVHPATLCSFAVSIQQVELQPIARNSHTRSHVIARGWHQCFFARYDMVWYDMVWYDMVW